MSTESTERTSVLRTIIIPTVISNYFLYFIKKLKKTLRHFESGS